MSYNLSNTERTLLSAYLDGEISATERVQAEQLLTRSEGARAYLNEIRAVHDLSGSVLTGTSILEGSSGAPFSAKLSGKAIEAAAEKAIYSKAVALGSWGLAGVAGVAAVAVGMVLSVATPSRPVAGNTSPRPVPQSRTMTAPEVTATAPVIDLDTSNLLVSPMTPSDLFAFAVDGTLPIKSTKGSYITLAPQGKASMALEVHADAPEDISERLLSFDAPALAMFDSIQRVVRTSLLQYSNERIALRADLQSLRLGVIRSFERAAPHMPMEIRERLDRSRMQIAAVQRSFGGGEIGVGGTGGPGEGNEDQIPYLLVSFGGTGDQMHQFDPPDERIIFNVSEPAVLIDQRSLVALQRMVPAPPVIPFFADADDARETLNVSPVGMRPRSKVKRYTVSASEQQGLQERDNIMSPNGLFPIPPQGANPPASPIRVQEGQSDIVRMREALQRADEAVRRADSIMQRMRKELEIKVRSEGRGNTIRLDGYNGRIEMNGSLNVEDSGTNDGPRINPGDTDKDDE